MSWINHKNVNCYTVHCINSAQGHFTGRLKNSKYVQIQDQFNLNDYHKHRYGNVQRFKTKSTKDRMFVTDRNCKNIVIFHQNISKLNSKLQR
jgi:hypothetical protein